MHLRRSSLEKASAAGTEQGVARKQQPLFWQVVCDMPPCVPGYGKDTSLAERGKVEVLIPRNMHVDAVDGLLWPDNNRFVAAFQFDDAPGVVGMVMGDQDGRQGEVVSGKPGINHRCIPRVYDKGVSTGRERPDVVVVECGERC